MKLRNFALASIEGDAFGPVIFAEQLEPGDVIPVGPSRHQRVLNVIPAETEDEYPLLYVDVEPSNARSAT